MGKNELITDISNKTGMAKVDCEKVVDAFGESIRDFLMDGKKVLLKGFMSFEVVDRAAHKGRNPKTGEVMLFPASKSVKCKISQSIKDAINEE